jgi:hypothetical protein
MGRKFIIWETWPVVLAMSLKECIMFALFLPAGDQVDLHALL